MLVRARNYQVDRPTSTRPIQDSLTGAATNPALGRIADRAW
jgi:hypothetical protein